MNVSVAISVAALLVSIASLAISVHFKRKEEAKIRASSQLFVGDEDHEPAIVVTAVNVGRRPAILRMLVGVGADKQWSGLMLGDDHQGIRLEENERFEKQQKASDLGVSHEEAEFEFTELYFEDSLGKRWTIRDSERHIKEFWKAHGKFRDAMSRTRKIQMEVRRALEARDT